MPQELTNPNNVPVTYSLSGADTTYVSIDASTGAITLNENTPLGQEIVFRVVATSSETTLYNQKSVYYDVNLYYEKSAAPISWPYPSMNISIGSSYPYKRAPQTLNNQENVPVTYSVHEEDATNFSFNTTNGEITLNRNTQILRSDGIRITATSSETPLYTQTSVTYNLKASGAKKESIDWPKSTYNLGLSSADLPYTGSPLTIDNPDNVPVTYSLSGAGSTNLSINETTGDITIPSGFPIEQCVKVNVKAEAPLTVGYKKTSVYYGLTICPELYFYTESITRDVSYDELPVTFDFSQYLANPADIYVQYTLPNQSSWPLDRYTGILTLTKDNVTKGSTYNVMVRVAEQQLPYRHPSLTMTLNIR